MIEVTRLDKIKAPSDIKGLTYKEAAELAEEMREVIIDTVSKTGGHLASNLGMVEASIALHRAFDSPRDKFIFDVGHQCYAHKLLTGRYEKFSTLRSFGGISGFTSPLESEHDILYEGHSGTSVSAALGIAMANKLRGDDSYTVAVVGDGSLTNGMIYEALNNCADEKLNLIIVINDNEMSISKNIGGLHNYLSRIRTSKGYFSFKRGFELGLSRIPLVGYPIAKFFKTIKDAIKHIFVPDTIFEDLGLIYLGPVDGNDIKKLSTVLEEAKLKHQCCVVHMITRKGLGYRDAEDRPDKYHSVGTFDVDGGLVSPSSGKCLSSSFGDTLCDIASRDSRVCAITAAMCDGTGLWRFSSEYPERFFDVGIAEEHAITFASGLAANGMKPVVALYSTFAQRVCDQLIHDVALQGLPLVLALDRCGLVAGDGITHQGIFDYPLFSAIPGAKIYSCADENDISAVLPTAVREDGLSMVRYPKGEITGKQHDLINSSWLSYTENVSKADVVIITHGRMTDVAMSVCIQLGEERVGVIKLLRVFPIDTHTVAKLCENCRLIYILDEGVRSGGLGEKLTAELCNLTSARIFTRAIDGFVEHGGLSELFDLCGFTEDKVGREIAELLE